SVEGSFGKGGGALTVTAGWFSVGYGSDGWEFGVNKSWDPLDLDKWFHWPKASLMASLTTDFHWKAPFGFKATCPNSPKGKGMPAGNDTVGGPCTLGLAALSYYVCGGNDVQSVATALMSVGGRDCSAQAVQSALVEISGRGGPSVGGPGGGGVG